MDVFDCTSTLPPRALNAVVAIGNFDAVHRGHQALLAKARHLADTKTVPLAVMTFEPHPRRLFRPDDPPFRVTPLAVKLDCLKNYSVDHVFVIPFNWNMAAMSAKQFVDDVLKSSIRPNAIVVGSDFHFGHNRSGSIEFLENNGIETHAVPLHHDEHHGVISATRIRGLIQSGHMDEVSMLLGWPWEIRGTVIHGDKRGREIGYPTANMRLEDTIHPAYGIYASLVQVEGDPTWHLAATNIGTRPMFETPVALVESYLLNYAGDLYGKIIRVRPTQKIRDEMKFESLEDLIEQIEKDCAVCKEILSKHH